MVAIESNGEDGDVRYLDLKLNYLREKKKQQNHIKKMVQAIISCFEKRCGNL